MKNNFILGTAQFGSSYGITNQLGQPSIQEIEKTLDLAFEQGVEYLDTALSYGNSLEKLANYFKKKAIYNCNIVTKFNLLNDYEETYDKLVEFLEKTSLDSFYALLIHDAGKLEQADLTKLNNFLNKILKNNIAKKIGLSIYTPSEAKSEIVGVPIGIIQCPINLFNQSFLSPDIIMPLKNNDIEIHARSVFLQGLLLSKELPDKLNKLSSHWQTYQSLIKELEIKPLKMILSWIKNQTIIDKWIIGVNTKNELVELVDIFKNLKPINNLDLKNLDISNHPLVDPRNW